MRIHAVRTGTVAVKARQRRGRGPGGLRLLLTLLDRAWTTPLPIYAWVLEHPEGLIVVDTGETARGGRPGYFPRWHPYFRLGVREAVRPEEEFGPQLRTLGLAPGDVRWVLLTHLHTDHAGGLHHFPGAEVLVARPEYDAAVGLGGQLRGYLPQRWPAWFAPRLVAYAPEPVGPFPASYAVTRAGDVRLVPTPGHTAGHQAVLLQDQGTAICFAGDASYTEGLLREQVVDGVAQDVAAARETLARLLAYARAGPTVYLPAHDPGAAARLAARTILRPEGPEPPAPAARGFANQKRQPTGVSLNAPRRTPPMPTSHWLDVPGARLYYETRGSGPLLMLIGHPMDSAGFAPLAAHFAADHTVVSYDPRGFGRSTIDERTQDAEPDLIADDVRRILEAVGGGPAQIFGSSGGAVTGLALVARHPDLVQTLIAHEPPLALMLPDAEHARKQVQDIYDTYRANGFGAAWRSFVAFTGLSMPAPGEGAAPQPPSEEMVAMSQRFFGQSFLPVTLYQPDIAALQAASTRVVVAGGVDSRGQFARRTADGLAERLGSPLVEFPGGHAGFLTNTDEFAAVLRRTLG